MPPVVFLVLAALPTLLDVDNALQALLGVAVVAAAIPAYRMIHVRRMAPAQELIA